MRSPPRNKTAPKPDLKATGPGAEARFSEAERRHPTAADQSAQRTPELVVDSFPKNLRGEEIRITTSEFKGHKLVGIRIWYRKDDELRPSKKGIAIPRRHLARIIGALRKTLEEGGDA